MLAVVDATGYVRLTLWTAWLLMWRRGDLTSCPSGEGGSISKSYYNTGHSRPLMSSQQQAAGAEEPRPEAWRPAVSRWSLHPAENEGMMIKTIYC